MIPHESNIYDSDKEKYTSETLTPPYSGYVHYVEMYIL
jgi:hypothetical protein